MKMIHVQCPDHPEASLEGYILDCELTLGQEKTRPAIVVCPGGGYVYCSPREGEPVALSYAACGFHAFLLRYSTGWDCTGFTPLEEISWVIGYLREHADEWNIDPNKIVTCGFSAGGHLALAAGVRAENRPDAMILGYCATVIPNVPGADFMLKLLTGKQTVDDEDVEQFNLLNNVDEKAPPAFMITTAEDLMTAGTTLDLAKKYSELGLGYELHVFQHGPHGYSLANEVTADGSYLVINAAFAQWQPLSVHWLHKIFGQPQFVNKSTSNMKQYLDALGFGQPAQKNAADFA